MQVSQSNQRDPSESPDARNGKKRTKMQDADAHAFAAHERAARFSICTLYKMIGENQPDYSRDRRSFS
jgi:hypothetical protein